MKYLTLFSLVMMAVSSLVNAAGNIESGKAKSMTCVACHQVDGNSSSSMYPKIASQHATYTAKQIRNIKNGEGRESAIMMPMVQGLSEQDILDLAAYFESQTIKTGETDKKYLALGKKIFRGGNPDSGVPACTGCHGPSGLGNKLSAIPALAGQYAEYTIQQLNYFAEDKRSNDMNAMMRNIASKMTQEEMTAVAHFIQGLYTEKGE